MGKNIGIVLKSYQPKKCKLSILDRDAGKIIAVPNRSDLSNGSLIQYFKRDQDHLSFIHTIDIIDMPFALAHEDIVFVHHILELCYYFIPNGSHAPQVFVALLRFYELPTILNTSGMKKIFALKIFSLLGVYPDSQRFTTTGIGQLMSTSIDILATQSIDLKIEQELDTWLLNCISTHPCAEYFKTINFLFMNKAL